MKLQYEKGFEGKKIISVGAVTIPKDHDKLTDKELITWYVELSKASHWRKNDKKGNKARTNADGFVDEVIARLVAKGWHAHMGDNNLCNCNANDYIHGAGCGLSVHQVPFCHNSNIDLKDEWLFDDDGKLVPKEQTLIRMKKDLGEKTIDIDQMFEDNEICEREAEIIKEIMEEEGLFELHELSDDNHQIRSGAKSYEWMDGEDEAEARARDYLEDGELWRMAVDAEQTTSSLDDWVDEVLAIDGWEPELCRYDGCAHYISNGVVYWRT